MKRRLKVIYKPRVKSDRDSTEYHAIQIYEDSNVRCTLVHQQFTPCQMSPIVQHPQGPQEKSL